MKLCSGQCKYLLAVYELGKTKKTVRSVDIANKLSVTRSSVSRMLKCMSRIGLIKSEYSLNVQLTDLGIEMGEKISEKFEIIYKFFFEILKLTEKEAYDQTIVFIASFPEKTVERLSKITKNTFIKRNQK